MGLSDHFVAARGESSVAGLQGARRLSRFDDWVFARLPDDADTDEMVERAAREGDGAAIGAWVFDSDFGYVVGADRNGVSFRLPINDPYDVEDPELWDTWRVDEKRAVALAELAEWSRRCAPSAASAEEIETKIMAADERDDLNEGLEPADQTVGPAFVFAEEGLRIVFRALGFPSLDEAVFTVE